MANDCAPLTVPMLLITGGRTLASSEPTQRLTWGADTITSVRFNQTETSVIASAGNDRTITLYDVRSGSPLSRVILEVRLVPHQSK